MQVSCFAPQLCSWESGLQVLFAWSVQLSLWSGLDSHLVLCVKWVCWQQQFYSVAGNLLTFQHLCVSEDTTPAGWEQP